MRIASLLPSATEIVYALGLSDQLVAVTHECDFPAEANDKLRATKNRLAPGLTSAQIDRAVIESTMCVDSVYELDVELLVSLKPDLIITQDLCRVCAVPRSSVDEVAGRLGGAPRVFSLGPGINRGRPHEHQGSWRRDGMRNRGTGTRRFAAGTPGVGR